MINFSNNSVKKTNYNKNSFNSDFSNDYLGLSGMYSQNLNPTQKTYFLNGSSADSAPIGDTNTGLKGLFSNAKGMLPKTLSKLKQGVSSNASWSGSNGLTLGQGMASDPNSTIGQLLPKGGLEIGKYAPWIQGGIGAIQAGTGLANISNTSNDTENLKNKIIALGINTPVSSNYLGSDQVALLNKLQNGRDIGNNPDFNDVLGGIGSGLGNTLLQTGMGAAAGGIPGAIVGGVSGLVNSGIQGYQNGMDENTATLEGLYQALQSANADYRQMKRPSFTGLGIQQQYQNQYR